MAEPTWININALRQSYVAECEQWARRQGLLRHPRPLRRPTQKPRCPKCHRPADWGHGEAGLILFAEEFHTVIDKDTGKERRMVLEPHQIDILRAMTEKDEAGRFKYRIWIYSTPKKSGKSEIGGLIGAWAALTMGAYNEVYFAANSRDQATTRAFAVAGRSFLSEHSLRSKYQIRLYKNEIYIDHNHSFIKAASAEYSTAAGVNPGMVVWDELWAFTTDDDERLWQELAPTPTRPDSVTVVVTYAGFENESKLLWDLYLKGVGPDEHKKGQGTRLFTDLPVWTNGPIFCYWDHEARMSWHTEEWLKDERIRCPGEATWLRQYENRWVTSINAFISPEHWDAIEDTALKELLANRGFEIAVGADIGTKDDSASVQAVYRDPDTGLIRLARYQIWIPPEGGVLDLEETVESFILELAEGYDVKGVWYDPSQMVRSAQTLTKKGVNMVEFPQTEVNLSESTKALYRVIRHKLFRAYPAPDLREHVVNAVTVEGARGLRLAKHKQDKKVDGCVALSFAIYGLEAELEDVADFGFASAPL